MPFALVAKEPDLGTALSFPVMLVVMYFWAGMPLGNLLLGLSPVFNVALFFLTGIDVVVRRAVRRCCSAFARPADVRRWSLMLVLNGVVAYELPHLWNHLHDYQKRRIETFINPENDPYGAGYQIIQSKIAIGSGGVLGKGYLQGLAEGARVPAHAPHRLHLLGRGRGTGLPRRVDRGDTLRRRRSCGVTGSPRWRATASPA